MIRIGYAPGAFDLFHIGHLNFLRFSVMFKGDDWMGTEKGQQFEQRFGELGVAIVYLPYEKITSSSVLRRTLKNIDDIASRLRQGHSTVSTAFNF